jgi:hypothetical protein
VDAVSRELLEVLVDGVGLGDDDGVALVVKAKY